MTLVVYPEGVTKSGSGGGTTHSHNRYGAYTRTRTIPVNPNTGRQVQMRNILAALTIFWDLILTAPQRAAWEVYAANVPWLNALGQTVHLTGFNHYLRSNSSRLQNTAGCPSVVRVDDAPIIFNLAVPEQALTIVAAEGTQFITASFDDTADWCSETGGFQGFYMGRPQNQSVNFYGGPWRRCGSQCGVDSPNGEPSSPHDMPVTFPVAQGEKVWLRSRIGRADARLSVFAIASCSVGA